MYNIDNVYTLCGKEQRSVIKIITEKRSGEDFPYAFINRLILLLWRILLHRLILYAPDLLNGVLHLFIQLLIGTAGERQEQQRAGQRPHPFQMFHVDFPFHL